MKTEMNICDVCKEKVARKDPLNKEISKCEFCEKELCITCMSFTGIYIYPYGGNYKALCNVTSCKTCSMSFERLLAEQNSQEKIKEVFTKKYKKQMVEWIGKTMLALKLQKEESDRINKK